MQQTEQVKESLNNLIIALDSGIIGKNSRPIVREMLSFEASMTLCELSNSNNLEETTERAENIILRILEEK